MTETISSYLFSEPFQFIVEDTIIHVHPKPISRLSNPLNSLINGLMCESQKGAATLRDVTASTFIRVCEWAYSGRYNAPQYIPLESPNEEILGENEVWPSAILSKPRRKKTTRAFEIGPENPTDQNQLWEAFQRLRRGFAQAAGMSMLIQSEQDHTSVICEALQPHIDLYIFSDKYEIQDLKAHTLNLIHETLGKAKVNHQSINEIIELAKRVYDCTIRRNNEVVDVRTVLKGFFDAKLCLMGVEELQKLMENEDLKEDILAMVVKRTQTIPKPTINNAETEVAINTND